MFNSLQVSGEGLEGHPVRVWAGSGVAAALGVMTYLKYLCQASVSWEADLLSRLPSVWPKGTIERQLLHRYLRKFSWRYFLLFFSHSSSFSSTTWSSVFFFFLSSLLLSLLLLCSVLHLWWPMSKVAVKYCTGWNYSTLSFFTCRLSTVRNCCTYSNTHISWIYLSWISAILDTFRPSDKNQLSRIVVSHAVCIQVMSWCTLRSPIARGTWE